MRSGGRAVYTIQTLCLITLSSGECCLNICYITHSVWDRGFALLKKIVSVKYCLYCSCGTTNVCNVFRNWCAVTELQTMKAVIFEKKKIRTQNETCSEASLHRQFWRAEGYSLTNIQRLRNSNYTFLHVDYCIQMKVGSISP